MGTLTQQVTVFLGAPWQWQRNQGGMGRFWMLAALLLLGGMAGAVWFSMPRPLAWVLGGALGACVVLATWGTQFYALLRLDHPHAARLVPGHSRALRSAALGLWLAVVLVCGIATAIAPSLPGSPTQRMLLGAVASGAALLYVAMALRWGGLWLAVWLVPWLLQQPRVEAAVRPLWNGAQAQWHEAPVYFSVLALLATAAALTQLFGRADSAHARAYDRREATHKSLWAAFTGQRLTAAERGHNKAAMGLRFWRGTDAWLAHTIRHADSGRRSVMARAEVVLYGDQHWVGMASGCVVALIALGVIAVMLNTLGYLDLAGMGEPGFIALAIGFSTLSLSSLFAARGAVWASRREQALLMLLPGMPQGVTLNQALARQQIKSYLLLWVATMPLTLAVAWWADMPYLLGYAAAAVPLAASLWRDLSRTQSPHPLSALLPLGLFMAVGLLSMLLLRWQPTLLLPWALGLLALTAALLAWRWRRLSQWPQALPAGRLS